LSKGGKHKKIEGIKMEFTTREYARINNAKLVCIGNASARVISEREATLDCTFGDFGRVVAFLELEDLKASHDGKRTVPAYLMENCGVYTVC
jgi:hypothetical protein